MSVQAQYLGMTWEISSERCAPIGSISTAIEVKKESDSTKGKAKITGKELQRIDLEYFTTFEAGGNPRKEYEEWETKIGKYGALRLGGVKFGANLYQLQAVSINDAMLDINGKIRSAKIALKLCEYVEAKSGAGTESDAMQIIYNGVDIYPKISVKSCEYTQYLESQADSIVMRFNDPNHLWDKWSVEQQSTIEVIEGATRTGKMFIYDLKPEQGLYTLRAFSIPPTSKNRTSKTWEKVQFLQLCREIAQRHNLTFSSFGVQDQLYDYVVQDNLPDFVFLDTRCKLEGCAFLVYNQKLVVYSEKQIENSTAQKMLELSSDAKFTYSDNTSKSYKYCEVVNGTRKGQYTAETQTGYKVLHKNITIPMSNEAEANRFAQNILRLENKNQNTGVIDWDIQRELSAGSVIQLKTIGAKSWDGNAFIYKLRHDFANEKSKIFIRKPMKY